MNEVSLSRVPLCTYQFGAVSAFVLTKSIGLIRWSWSSTVVLDFLMYSSGVRPVSSRPLPSPATALWFQLYSV